MTASRSRRLAALAAAATVLASLLTACTAGGTPAERTAAQRFLTAVGHGDAAAAAALTTAPATARAGLQASLTGLGSGARGTLTARSVHTTGARSSVELTAAWTLPGSTTAWRYRGAVALARSGGTWRVVWSPADLYPGLAPGTHLLAVRSQPARAALEAADGTALFTDTPIVRVGIEPRLVTDLASLARTLAAVPQLQSSAAQITSAVRAAPDPTDFVPVITLRRPAYEQIRARIHDLPGTVFQQASELLPPSAHWAEPLLGSVGPATAAAVSAAHGRLAVGDQTGLGGLQQAYDATLSGTPGITVVAANGGGAAVRTLSTVSRPVAGRPVRLTLDRPTQNAAEQVVTALPQAAAIVAVQPSTGRILADADSTATTYDYALAGAFPPGSTFKIATWTAAFTTDPRLTAASTVRCPATVTVDGRVFENENRFSYPPIPISSAFGYSCNTSAIAQAARMPATAIGTAARALGLGASWSLPVAAYAGTVPAPSGATEQAADAIGQGRVLVSPLLMALMAGAAATGTPVRPSLLAGAPVVRGTTLPAPVTAQMRTLLRATVALAAGTGHVLDDLPTVLGKTGTAEYGSETPPRTHAWFAGVQGDVAFAVFVYDGASQGVNPSEVAHRFLSALPQR